jgi:glucose/arabinose dehydrogenase
MRLALLALSLLVLAAAPALVQPPSGPSSSLVLPPPGATPSTANSSNAIGWPEGRAPTAPPGFAVTAYAKLESPRSLLVLANGDVLVGQATGEHEGSPNRVTLLRGLRPNGSAAQTLTFATGFDNPFGLAMAGGYVFIADTKTVRRWPFRVGQSRVNGPGQVIMRLPGAQASTYGHWTRSLVAAPDSKSLFVGVGSSSNIADHGMAAEEGRAAIWQVGLDGAGARIFAGGLRNPIGTAFVPGTNDLWAVVNERDGLGDNLPPDYLAHVVDGGFYGWPWRYYGRVDARVKPPAPAFAAQARVPEYALGAHVASLGLLFYRGAAFPAEWRGAFIGEHGSWNRAHLSGYRVAFVPFTAGRPAAQPLKDFLTGFVADPAEASVYGRPVGVAEMTDGSLLVADDAGGRVWRVAWTGRRL